MASRKASSKPSEEWSSEYWEKGRSPWHRSYVSSHLVNHFSGVTSGEKNLKVLVPLCGKSVDMKWLADAGHRVVGVEGARVGIIAFMEEHNLQYDVEETSVGGCSAEVYTAKEQPIRIYRCDMLAFTREVEGVFDVIWDRAAFEAIEICDRDRYAHVLIDVLKHDGGKYLLNVYEYDPALNPEAKLSPYPIPDNIPEEHFGNCCSIVKLDSREVTPEEHRPSWFPERTALAENIFLITKTPIYIDVLI